MRRQVVVEQDNGYFIAKDIDSGVVSQGRSEKEARANLLEALELYFEDSIECMGSIAEF